YRARQVERADFHRFDWIFALDADNLATLRLLAPDGGRARLSLLLDMVPGREGEAVVDPYFGDEAGFDLSWADVSAAADALVARLLGADPRDRDVR
ncbi:MAG: low molecular weight phosphotyrosine protein phosphatase, partial [Sphingomonadales bacterium]|nr:low molecular weight phosphotyrosine protein phosphatase [Sphingomonadales bacterium]